MLSVKTIVELKVEAPESSGDGAPRPDRGTASGREGSVGQSPEPGAAATLPSDRMNGPEDPGALSATDGGPATPEGDPCDGRHIEGILIPEDPRRAGCLSMWLAGVMVFNALGLILMLQEGTFDPIVCGFCLANITFAAALWHLKRWGSIGLASSFVLSSVLGLIIQDLYTIMGSILPMILLYAFVKPRWEVLE